MSDVLDDPIDVDYSSGSSGTGGDDDDDDGMILRKLKPKMLLPSILSQTTALETCGKRCRGNRKQR